MNKKDYILHNYINKTLKPPKKRTIKQSDVFKMKSSHKLKIPGKYDEEVNRFLKQIK